MSHLGRRYEKADAIFGKESKERFLAICLGFGGRLVELKRGRAVGRRF
jgi:hypothetical protein